MKRLFTFGCSHTCHGYPTWANILAEEFDEHINFGQAGSGPLYAFYQISNLINNKEKWKLSEDDYFVLLIPEENRNDVVIGNGVPEFGNERIVTNTIHNDCEEWYTDKYKREFSPSDGLIKTTLYIESIVRLFQNHRFNYKIINALYGLHYQNTDRYKLYKEHLKNLIGHSDSLQTIAKEHTEKEIHYYFLNEQNELEWDGHWYIPIHLQFVKSNFDFYKETNVDKYLDIHESITKTNLFNVNEYSAKYHYAYWPCGGLFSSSQNKLLSL